MKINGGFEQLAKKEDFTNCMISVIFDEAHCISAWGAFWPEYKEVGHLCYILPKNIPIIIMSATLPPLVFNDVKEILQLRFDKLSLLYFSLAKSHIQFRPDSPDAFVNTVQISPKFKMGPHTTGWSA